MKVKTFGSFLMAAVTAISAPLASFAAESNVRLMDNSSSPQYFLITRDITGVTNPVSNTFKYTISADSSNPASVGNLPEEVELNFIGEIPNSEHTVTSRVAVDFSEVSFSKLGDYSFLVKESYSSDLSNYPLDDSAGFSVLVSVRNEIVNGSYTGKLQANMQLQALDVDSGEKTDIEFSSEAIRSYIELSKEVTGNAADQDEYFEFHINFDGLSDGDRLTINGQDSEINYRGQNISTNNQYVVGQENSIYLKHGQTINVGLGDGLNELPIGVKYSIVESEADGYTTYADGVLSLQTGEKTVEKEVDGVIPMANITSFVNHKETDVLTGVTMVALPIVVLALFGVGGYMIRKKISTASTKR